MNPWVSILKGKTQQFVDGLKYGLNEFAVRKEGREIVGCGIGCGVMTKKAVFKEIDEAWEVISEERLMDLVR